MTPDEQRHVDRRASDRTAHDLLDRLKRAPLTPKSLAMIFAAFLAVNQAINWWRERELGPVVRRIETLAAGLDTTNRLLRSKVDADDFMNYAICQQFKRNVDRGISDSYPQHCDSPGITRFESARVVRPPVPPRR